MPPEQTPTCHSSPMHTVPARIWWLESPFAPRHILKGRKPLSARTRWGPTSSHAGAAVAPDAPGPLWLATLLPPAAALSPMQVPAPSSETCEIDLLLPGAFCHPA